MRFTAWALASEGLSFCTFPAAFFAASSSEVLLDDAAALFGRPRETAWPAGASRDIRMTPVFADAFAAAAPVAGAAAAGAPFTLGEAGAALVLLVDCWAVGLPAPLEATGAGPLSTGAAGADAFAAGAGAEAAAAVTAVAAEDAFGVFSLRIAGGGRACHVRTGAVGAIYGKHPGDRGGAPRGGGVVATGAPLLVRERSLTSPRRRSPRERVSGCRL